MQCLAAIVRKLKAVHLNEVDGEGVSYYLNLALSLCDLHALLLSVAPDDGTALERLQRHP